MDSASLEDLFRPFANVRIKRMFGGHGVYAGELFFALVIGGDVFLKVDGQTEARFREAGSRPFVYDGAAKPVTVAYWRLPDTAYDDEIELIAWSRLALDAASRAATAKAAKRPGKPRPTKRRAD